MFALITSAIVVEVNINMNSSNVNLSDISLSNIKILAKGKGKVSQGDYTVLIMQMERVVVHVAQNCYI